MGMIKKVELIANVAIIVVACLLSGLLIKNYYLKKSTQQSNNAETERTINETELSSLSYTVPCCFMARSPSVSSDSWSEEIQNWSWRRCEID